MMRRKTVLGTGQRGWKPPRAAKKRNHLWLMGVCSVCIAALYAALMESPTQVETKAYPVSAAQPAKEQRNVLPSCIIQGLPAGEKVYTISILEDRMKSGHMLLIDEAHGIPRDFEPPASYNILQRSKGRVACRDTTAVLAGDALDGLDNLFRNARYARHNSLVVFAASRSEEQQRVALIDRMDALSRNMTFEEALAQAKREIELPGHSEHQLPWCVDIRICSAWNALPDDKPLDASEAGKWLLAHAWEYGFIHRYPKAETESHRAWHFRYVGKGHAAMMHAMNVSLEAYLSLLREYGTLTLLDDAGQPAVTVICQKAKEGETRFTLPLHGTVEDASYDNCGWALVSCLYQ